MDTKALRQIGIKKAFRFGIFVPLLGIFSILGYPFFRRWYLKILGVRIGKNTIIHAVRFINAYRKGFSGLSFGNNVFIGDDSMLDLAESISFEDNVTLAGRVTILTHLNVGYKDHPLQKHFPSSSQPVHIKEGAFIGVNVTILSGVTIGLRSFIAAGSVITKNVPDDTLVGGVPGREIRRISEQ